MKTNQGNKTKEQRRKEPTIRAMINEYTKKKTKRRNEDRTNNGKLTKTTLSHNEYNRLVWAPSGKKRSKKKSTSEMRMQNPETNDRNWDGDDPRGICLWRQLKPRWHTKISVKHWTQEQKHAEFISAASWRMKREKSSQCKWGIVV